MEIIKRGILPNERKFRGTCIYCDSVIEAKREELRGEENCEGNLVIAYGDCPVCDRMITFHPVELRMPKVRELKTEPVAAPVEDEFSHWEQGKYECKCPGCGGKAYSARIFGPWAVYKHYNDANGWELIHVKTNLAAMSMVPEEEAMRAGDWLFRKFPLVFRLVDLKEIRAKLETIKPEMVGILKEWKARCEKAKKFIVPVSLA